MAYKVIILYQLYMPSYFLGTFTEYPYIVTRTSDYQVIVPAVRFRNLIHTEIDPDSSQTIRICFIQYNERIVHTPIKNHFPVV